ncbi:hypothetical protein [Pontibacter vulgaris]|uniref:hypothetical protein n=1 Tax=Pontibacter vulgaris TaxID=2905679 RepID=UPI001FA7546C|nr:hypothetical protein [Pontibacter vulgaris]
MIKVEPVSILKFIATHFGIIRDLYETQKNERLIKREIFEIICSRNNAEGIRKQLFDYKIIKPVQEDYELRDIYFNLIEFLLYEFRPLLPDEIEKYGVAISELFRKIKEGINGDKNILLDRLSALSYQIKEFSESIDRNKIRLLSETRNLKANVNKIDYREKIQKASFWTEHYILPLNKILDVNHSESIANRLFAISEYANHIRLTLTEETIRNEFEKLYFQLNQTNDELLLQSKILLNELIPLIDRIRTESLVLTGWLEFIKNPYKSESPKLFKTERLTPISSKFNLNCKEYFEQFTETEDVFIEENLTEVNRWIFNKSLFKQNLVSSLPVDDFFEWCKLSLLDQGELTNEKLLSLTTLLFEEELVISNSAEAESTKIQTNNSVFILPKIIVQNNEI